MRSRTGILPRDRSRSVAFVAAPGLGLVEQIVDDAQLLEHVVAVLEELRGGGVERRAVRRREQNLLHGPILVTASSAGFSTVVREKSPRDAGRRRAPPRPSPTRRARVPRTPERARSKGRV